MLAGCYKELSVLPAQHLLSCWATGHRSQVTLRVVMRAVETAQVYVSGSCLWARFFTFIINYDQAGQSLKTFSSNHLRFQDLLTLTSSPPSPDP